MQEPKTRRWYLMYAGVRQPIASHRGPRAESGKPSILQQGARLVSIVTGGIVNVRYAVAASSLAITLPLASVSAQSPPSAQTPPPAQSTAPEPAKWSFSLGADPSNFDLHRAPPGMEARMVANLARSWQSAHSRFARHIVLMVGADLPVEAQPGIIGLFGPQCDCPMRVSRRYAGLTAGASFDLFHVSRFTPYVTGGTGIYYYGYRRSPVNASLTPSEVEFYQSVGFAQDYLSLGANGGLGLKVRLGSHDFFFEQMLHSMDLNRRGWAVAPLNVGIRF